jgi:hypothetical protein
MTKAWIVAAALAGLSLFAMSAQASTITLTGGDLGEGYVPLSSTFGALDLGGVGGFIVQGVDFTESDPHIALSPVLSGQAAVFDLGDTANDNRLDAILFTVVSQQPGPFTLTVTGLTVGTSYQFDYFLGLIGGNRTVQFSAAGQTTIVDKVRPLLSTCASSGNRTAAFSCHAAARCREGLLYSGAARRTRS